jgi:hypothetical protein
MNPKQKTQNLEKPNFSKPIWEERLTNFAKMARLIGTLTRENCIPYLRTSHGGERQAATGASDAATAAATRYTAI